MVGDDLIEWIDQFLYLGAVTADEGIIYADVDLRITNASKAFGVLH